MNVKEIESKWQKKWEEKKVFSVDVDKDKPKFYNLEMFPYPSGVGLHMGHALNYTIGDIRARFKRMSGFNVLYPMGYDSFGLPAENAAIKAGTHPRDYTKQAISNFIEQQKALGISYDWDKLLSSCEPEYYKWNQKFFIEFLKNGLAYRKHANVNWCPKCNTVLANEQVVNGCCWRHEDTEVEIKPLEQWFINTTKYADELLDCIDNLNWPERIKLMQKNWIGKSYGAEIDFEVEGEKFPIFTTRPDTLFGVTFMVIAAQHPKLMDLVSDEQKNDVEDFLKKIKSVSEKEQKDLEKEGVFTGSYAVNPANGEKIPIWAGNFVLAEYGSGMVMAVPAHDKRDFAFAKKYGIEIKPVVKPADFDVDKMAEAYVGEGNLINSEKFDGVGNVDAKKEIVKFLEKKNLARESVQYKMRDWLISRQRYWGTPIPVVYCDRCGVVPEKEENLPIELPYDVKFGDGNPLETNEEFVNCKCPVCGADARRETDTMDTFVDSSWYFMRYPDNKNSSEPFDKEKEKYWLPVDTYIGGAEHATMHLLYARFWTKALRDLGYVGYDEPFKQLFNQGMLHASDGRKMSKSLGNVINPLTIVEKEGADALRLTLMSFASPDSDTNWDEKVLQGSLKFLTKVYDKFENMNIGGSSERIESKLNKTIKDVSDDFENFRYDLAIIKIRALFNALGDEEEKEGGEKRGKGGQPICPHLTEELWEKLNGKDFICLSSWPEAEESKINEDFEKQEQAVEKLVSDLSYVKNLIKDKENKDVKKGFVYVLPNEFKIYSEMKNDLQRRTDLKIEIFAVNDSEKYDPDNKSKNVKPGKAGIYLE